MAGVGKPDGDEDTAQPAHSESGHEPEPDLVRTSALAGFPDDPRHLDAVGDQEGSAELSEGIGLAGGWSPFEEPEREYGCRSGYDRDA